MTANCIILLKKEGMLYNIPYERDTITSATRVLPLYLSPPAKRTKPSSVISSVPSTTFLTMSSRKTEQLMLVFPSFPTRYSRFLTYSFPIFSSPR